MVSVGGLHRDCGFVVVSFMLLCSWRICIFGEYNIYIYIYIWRIYIFGEYNIYMVGSIHDSIIQFNDDYDCVKRIDI